MSNPIHTRMTDEEWKRHQASDEWRVAAGFGKAWRSREWEAIEAKRNKAVERAERQYAAALAKAEATRKAAHDDLNERECDRVNKDITDVAVKLGIWHR